MKDLNELHYKILEFIAIENSTTEKAVFEKFPIDDYDTVTRLQVLEDNYFIDCPEDFINGGSLSGYVRNGNINITDEGKQALHDFLFKKKKDFIKVWEDRLWRLAPIIISIISLLKSYNFI